MAVWAHLFNIDSKVLGGTQFGVLVQGTFWGVTVRTCVFLHFDDRRQRVLSGMQVTVQTHVCILTVCCMQLRWLSAVVWDSAWGAG